MFLGSDVLSELYIPVSALVVLPWRWVVPSCGPALRGGQWPPSSQPFVTLIDNTEHFLAKVMHYRIIVL